MKRIGSAISAIVLAGSLVGAAYAQDNTSSNDNFENYCHQKFPAIRPRTLAGDNPQVKSENTGDVIDYYGACNQTPTSQDQVLDQKHEEEFSFGRQYEDGD